MAELTDHELLTRFARTGDQAAFAALVTRHVNLVWSAARRFTGDDTLAGEVTQAVFIILAQKAGKLSPATVLTGWLYQTARLTAANALKENRRRQHREHQAYLEATMTPNETNEAWQQLAPVLDEAMHALRTADRDAVLLRYFENKSLADVGAALGVTEDAARVRVNRALDKLRALLAKQGIQFGVTAIAAAVAANAVSAAPAALAANITTAVLTGTSLTLATVAMTTLQKIAVTAALTVTIGGGLLAAKQAHDAQNAVRTLHAQQAPLAEQVQQLQAERDKATNQIAGLKEELAKNEKNNLELLKLRGQVGVLQTQLANGSSAKAKVEQPPLSSAKEYFKRAMDHNMNHEYEAEIEDLSKAIELDPSMADAYVDRANLYASNMPLKTGGFEKAIADYTSCLAIQPDNASARWNRATYYSQIGKYDEAIADWTTYIEGDTDFSHQLEGKAKSIAGAYFWRANIYQYHKQYYSKAIADYTSALQLDPQVEHGHRQRGQCYESLGETEKAQEDFAIEPKLN